MGRSLYIKITAMLCAIALIGAGITALTAAPHTVRRAGVRIVTSFYPVYIAAQNVANGVDGVEVVNMVDGQFGCLHDYQMSPLDRVVMDSADIFVMNGAGAEPFLEAVLAHHAPPVVITLSQGIPLLESGHVHSHDGRSTVTRTGRKPKPRRSTIICGYRRGVTANRSGRCVTA